ncbi:MAG: tetratricopeptide repeat protein [Crocinitomicaceae bacterium]|nr:tetratricopeptide repeat protein [Crocinitomicaceae bacterium]
MKTYITYILFLSFVFSACKARDVTATHRESKHNGHLSAEALIRFQEKFFQAQTEKVLGNTEKAFQAFSECLIADPASGAVHYELARIERISHGDPDAALPHIKQAVSTDPANPWYQYELGDTYTALAKFDLASKAYKEVARLNPEDPNALFEQASALLHLGKTQEAINVYDELEKKSGPYEELSFQKHQLYIDLKNYKKAGEELEKLAVTFPEEPRYWGLAAQFYQQTRQTEKALYSLEKLTSLDPGNGQVHFQLSEYYAAAGDDKRSYDELKKSFATTDIPIDQKIGVLLKYYTLTEITPSYLPQVYELIDLTEKIHPDEAKIFSMHGDFLYRDGEDEKALLKYLRAIELDPSRNQIWAQVLSLQGTLRKYSEMEKSSARAMELFPSIPEFYYYNGIANDHLKEYERSAESLSAGKELVVENDKLLGRFYSALGSVYHSLGQYEKSDQSFDAALALDPADALVLNNYAYYLSLRKERLEKANEMAKLCNNLSPGNALFQDTYAWVLFQQGNYSDAATWIEKAVIGSPMNSDVWEHRGDIQYKLGKKNEAVESWKKAASIGNDSEELQQKISSQRLVE